MLDLTKLWLTFNHRNVQHHFKFDPDNSGKKSSGGQQGSASYGRYEYCMVTSVGFNPIGFRVQNFYIRVNYDENKPWYSDIKHQTFQTPNNDIKLILT